MPSGLESLVPHPAYSQEFQRARAMLRAHPGRWRIIYHYDGDGIASASSLVRALSREGYPTQATPLVGVEGPRFAQLLAATTGPVLVVDTGASWPDRMAEHPAPVIVLDHHKYPGAPEPPKLPDHVAFVNPLDWGVDGMREMCAATLAWLFTIWLDEANWENAPWGISGAVADRQHLGGFHGLNARLVDEAVRRGFVQRHRGLPLSGPTVGDGLSRCIDPFFAGLSGRPTACTQFLQEIAIDPHRPLHSLEAVEEQRLTTALLTRLVRQKVRPEFCETVQQERWFLPGPGLDAVELSNLQNATGRLGTPGVGIALALGDPQAMGRAARAEEQWREGLLRGLRRIEEEGVHSRRAVQWFESPDTTLAGTQAGLAMNYLLDPRRPVLVFSPGYGQLKVSARGTLWLVDRGLDLASACREAAAAVGGEGGGHRVASGASIPAEARESFLEHADRIVAGQIPLEPAEAAA